MTELSLCLGLILIILYGLFSMSVQETSMHAQVSSIRALTPNVAINMQSQVSTKMVNLHLSDVYFFSRLWPIMLLLGYAIDLPMVDSFLNQTASDVSIAT